MEFLYFLIISITAGLCTAESWSDTEDNICPKLYPKKFLNYSPIGNITAGNYTNNEEIKGLKNCVRACCLADSCNVVFIYNEVCYHIECVSNELCLPLLRTDLGLKEQMSMILVKPVLSDDNWSDILNQANYLQFSNMLPEVPEDISSYAYPSQQNRILNSDDIFPLRYQNNYPNLEDRIDNNKYVESDLMMDATSLLDKVACNIGNNDCPINYVCVPFNLQTRNGICKCRKGTQENSQGECVERPFSKGPTDLDGFIKKDDLLTMDPQAGQNLTVEVLSKEIRLPDNEVTLSAYTIPEASNNNYSYAWTLVDQPKDHFTGNMKQNGATVTLTDLKEGQYRFKVIVKGTNSYGEDYANVTVLPATRVNKPPQAVVQPQKQTVKLPVAMVVLDGSSSTDDTNIISYHWDLTSGPLGYQLGVQDGQILKLNDLKQPGNYTFKLTVQDSDLAKNSTTANITVLNHTDYPPEANAGQDVILYLPNNNLTLNGSLSTDDHEITSWEWTKAAEDENKAVDMQNTHSPYLQLSNLSEGMYKFVLKVTDSSGQSSTAEVHVFVKPPTNTPPVASAGADMQISLPQTWVVLNGSASHDDHTIVSFNWQCTSGPNNATIEQSNSSIANATGLTKGQYEFQLVVVDDNGNRGTDTVAVTVEQNKNSPPKANAGGDQVLVLPVPVLILNGSKSSDDFRIRSYKWTRASVGLAAGTIIFESDTKPVLMLTNIEAGRYVFELTVTDDQGETDHDTVSVQIKANPIEDKLIEITLNTPVSSFTQNQLDSLVQKINLLMKEGIQINVTEIRGQIDTGNTQIIAFLASKDAPLPATESLKMLRVSSASLGLTLRSVGCVSRCSGRGHCDKATRSCRCNAFWMQSLFNQWTSEEPDCDWSVVYASIGGVLIMCLLCGACSMCSRLLRRIGGCQYKPKSTYKLVPLADREDQPFAVKNISESDSDSDVQIFESTKISSFTTRTSNGDVRPKKNGHYKPIRKEENAKILTDFGRIGRPISINRPSVETVRRNAH